MKNIKIMKKWILISLMLLFTTGMSCQARRAYQAADRSVKEAQEERSIRLAPFYFTLAEEYLKEAKKQIEEADFPTSIEYSQKAQQFALEAIEESRRRQTLIHPPPPPPFLSPGTPSSETPLLPSKEERASFPKEETETGPSWPSTEEAPTGKEQEFPSLEEESLEEEKKQETSEEENADSL